MNKLQETFNGIRYVISLTDNGEEVYYAGYTVKSDNTWEVNFSSLISSAKTFLPISLTRHLVMNMIKNEEKAKEYKPLLRFKKVMPLKQHISSDFNMKGK